MADIVISEFMDQAAIALLSAKHDVLYAPDLVDHPEKLRPALADARALIVRNRTQVKTEFLASAPHLRVIGRLGVGLDNIDMDACEARGIAVYPAIGANDVSVAEYVMATALMLLRRAYQATNTVISGEWPRTRLIGREVQGKTLGLVGYGAIAREVARRAQVFGMTIGAFDPFVEPGDPVWNGINRYDLDELLSSSDVVSLHVPLTPETRNLIDAEAIGRMRQGAVLINSARGGIVDEEALANALRTGRLSGAALDVFAEEPLSVAHGAVFTDVPNLVLTPHIAGVTEESNVRVSRVTAENVLRHLDGKNVR